MNNIPILTPLPEFKENIRLLDYFAGQALVALISHQGSLNIDSTVDKAYSIASKMIITKHKYDKYG